MRIHSSLLAVAALALTSSAALAADPAPTPTPVPVFVEPETTGYTVTVGAGPAIVNSFPGSKGVTILPNFHLGYRPVGEPEPFYTPDDAFDVALYENPYFRVGPAANYVNARGLSGGNGSFYGLHDIGGTVEVGGFVEAHPIPNHVRVRAELLQGVTGSKGLVGNIGADAIQKTGPLEFSIGPRIGFGSDRYANQYFGITPAESLANGKVMAYRASGGLTSIGGLASLRYDINPRYSLLTFGGYSRLVESVGASPAAYALGSRNQFTAGTTLNYNFNFKGFGFLGH